MKQAYSQDIFSLLSILANHGGFTCKNYEIVSYKTGWQVGLSGMETDSLKKAIEYIKTLNGSFGVWYENGIYYIDETKRIDTKKEALRIGREHHQQTVYGWARGALAYC